jgi:hypothetical protein
MNYREIATHIFMDWMKYSFEREDFVEKHKKYKTAILEWFKTGMPQTGTDDIDFIMQLEYYLVRYDTKLGRALE